jgi:hypothetical protein
MIIRQITSIDLIIDPTCTFTFAAFATQNWYEWVGIGFFA